LAAPSSVWTCVNQRPIVLCCPKRRRGRSTGCEASPCPVRFDLFECASASLGPRDVEDTEHRPHGMGAGGEAPPIKARDVLMLVGLTLLVASVVMRAWDDPVAVTPDAPLEGTSMMPSGGDVSIAYAVSESVTITVRLEVNGEEVLRQVLPVAAGDEASIEYEMEERGELTWSVTVAQGGAEVDVDLARGLLAVAVPPVLGALLVAYAVVLSRGDEGYGTASDADVDAVVDAVLLE